VLEGILVGIIDASLLRKAMQSCSGVDNRYAYGRLAPIEVIHGASIAA
jgi:hypothetical protein